MSSRPVTGLLWRIETNSEEHAMAKINVHEFITLDGVVDTPMWTMDHGFDPTMGDAMGAIFGSCTALLLGRTTYEMFAQSWPQRTADDDPGAPFFNDSTKYVVTSTRTESIWQNTELIGGYDAEAIRRLKADHDGDLYVSGSATLVRSLLADGLVDALHLFVYPTTRGTGPWLFAQDAAPAMLTLADSAVYDNGVVHLNYQPRV